MSEPWAAGFYAAEHAAQRVLYVWAVFHSRALDDPASSRAVPPIPPMVLQMLNRASEHAQWRLLIGERGEATHADNTMGRCLTDLASLLSPNWWHAFGFCSKFPNPRWFATLPLRLRRLDLSDVPSNAKLPTGLMQTAPMRAVTHVEMRQSASLSVTDVVPHLPRLTSLTLHGSITHDDLRIVALKGTLTRFATSDCESLLCLSDSTSLREVVLKMSSIKSEGLAGLERIATLRNVDLSFCKLVTSVSSLGASTSLTELQLFSSSVTSEGLVGLERIPTLTRLGLSNCPAVSSVSSLAGSTSLADVDLQWSSVRSEGLIGLERIPTLTKLNLSFCKAVTAVSCLSTSTSLSDLRLVGSAVTSEGLTGLVCIPTLTRLHVSHCKAVKSVSCLAASTSLQELDVTGSSATDALEVVRKIPALAKRGTGGLV